MKKKAIKFISAAAFMSLGIFTMSAFAAEGWSLSNNTWVYLDKNDQRVINEWKKGADNLWRYLDSKGEMAINTWADEEYFVDADGIMVVNQWMQTQPQFDRYGEAKWFYFGSNGKIVRDGIKKIDGRSYLFDSEGIMQTGWSEDGMYYLGEDGAMKTGWRYIEAPEDQRDDYYGSGSLDGMYWYYFSSNGKKYTPATSNDGEDFRVSRIDGKYYCFNYDGQMQTGWIYMEGNPDTADGNTIKNWRYFAEEGIRNAALGSAVPGWLSLEPPEMLQDNVDEPVVWYYFEKDGVPKMGPDDKNVSTDDFIRVDGKTYLFNEKGNPVEGLVKVEIGSTGEYTSYYFDENSKTALKGRQTVEEGDGTKSTFYFNEGSNVGRGVTGVKGNYLYYMGKRQEADSDSRYSLVSIPDDSGYKTYVVNTSGRISKNTTVKDRDGNQYKVGSSGLLEEINGEKAGDGSYGTPVEPIYDEYDY